MLRNKREVMRTTCVWLRFVLLRSLCGTTVKDITMDEYISLGWLNEKQINRRRKGMPFEMI